MTESSNKSHYTHYLLSIIPIGIVCAFIFGMFEAIPLNISSVTLWIVAIGIGSLYGTIVYLSHSFKAGQWLGYLHVTNGIILFSLGLTNALNIIIIASIIAVVLQNQLRYVPRSKSSQLAEISKWISLSGIVLLVEYVVYVILFNQSLPLIDLTAESLSLVVFTHVVGAVSGVLIASLITRQSFISALKKTFDQRSPIYEILLLIITAIIAVTLYAINALTFMLVIGFVSAQVIYEYRTHKLREDSTNRLRDLSTLNNVAQAVSVNLVLDEVLDSVYGEVNKLVNATVIFVALYDDEYDQIDYPLVMENSTRTTWQQRQLANGLTDYIIQHKQLLYIRQTEIERLQMLQIDVNMMESKAYIGIPIMIGEKLLGVMGILNNEEYDVLGTTSLSVLQSVVNQASLAIRNATLYERTTRLAENLSLINESIQDVMFNLDQEEALLSAAKTAMTITEAHQVAIFFIDIKDKPSVRLVQSLGLSVAFKTALEDKLLDWFNHGLNEKRIINNIEDCDNDSIKELAHIGNFKAFAGIPMRSGNTVIGYLVIYHPQPQQYHPLEIDLLEMLTSQITVALDNADLLQALEVYASEQAELVQLSSISSSSLELEKVITDVSHQLRKMLKVTQVEIGLYVAETNHIHIYNTHLSGHLDVSEYDLSAYPEFQINVNHKIQYPYTMFASDVDVSQQIQQYIQENAYQMMAIMPMIINNEAIGVILMGDAQERVFQDNERRLIEMATTQIAAQIHNTQIHTLTEEALVQRLEQLSLIEDIGQKISRSLDLDLIINNVLEAAMRSTQADTVSIALLNNESSVRIKQQSQNGLDTVTNTYERSVDDGVIGQVMQNGMMRVISDNRKAKEYISPPDDKTYLSSLAVPLSKGEQTIGVLNVESVHTNFFTDEHAGFIKSLAGHAVISIDNANLLEGHQEQIQVLSQLRELAITASITTSTDSIVNIIIRTATEMLKGNGATLIPYNVDNHKFDVTSTLGWLRLGENYVQDVFFIPESLLLQVGDTSDALIIEDVKSQMHYRSYPQINQVNYQSIVIIPISHRNQISELLCIVFRERRYFTGQDKNTVQLLQVQIANHLENVKLAEEVHSSNVQMRAILDSTRDGIILLDREGNLQDSNISAEELLNIDLSNSHNQNFTSILINHNYPVTEEASYADLMETARILRTEPERNMIREYSLHVGGKTVHIREVSSPVWDSDNKIIGRLLSLRDVTEERALEEFRSRLQSMIVHDLKSPLSAIITSMVLGDDILKDIEDPKLVDDLSQLLHVAQESAGNLLGLVESMLDIGKLQRKQMGLQTVSVTVQEIAETAYTSLLASFKQANIKMTYDIPQDITDVFVDEGLIRRVFVNLIQNALKFTPSEGEIRVTARISQDRQDYVEVMVSDTGPGIPPQHRKRIFSEFATIEDRSQKQQRGPRGQGLGLTFCKLAIEEHGGHIWIAEEGPLPGATFAFTLPTILQRTTA